MSIFKICAILPSLTPTIRSNPYRKIAKFVKLHDTGRIFPIFFFHPLIRTIEGTTVFTNVGFYPTYKYMLQNDNSIIDTHSYNTRPV